MNNHSSCNSNSDLIMIFSNVQDNEGNTIIHWCISMQEIEFTRDILYKIEQYDAKSYQSGDSNDTEDTNFDFTLKNNQGISPFLLAASEFNDVIGIFIGNGSDILLDICSEILLKGGDINETIGKK